MKASSASSTQLSRTGSMIKVRSKSWTRIIMISWMTSYTGWNSMTIKETTAWRAWHRKNARKSPCSIVWSRIPFTSIIWERTSHSLQRKSQKAHFQCHTGPMKLIQMTTLNLIVSISTISEEHYLRRKESLSWTPLGKHGVVEKERRPSLWPMSRQEMAKSLWMENPC